MLRKGKDNISKGVGLQRDGITRVHNIQKTQTNKKQKQTRLYNDKNSKSHNFN
jgi:hypothetical protein